MSFIKKAEKLSLDSFGKQDKMQMETIKAIN
jgi:hypothetical protein